MKITQQTTSVQLLGEKNNKKTTKKNKMRKKQTCDMGKPRLQEEINFSYEWLLVEQLNVLVCPPGELGFCIVLRTKETCFVWLTISCW